MELDARRVYLGEGYSSLFTYCTQALHLAEGAAYNRIETARAARRFPTILEGLEDGSLTMTAIRLLAPHLTVENYTSVLASARHQRKHAIEELVASLNPKPAVPAIVRKLPAPTQRERECSALQFASLAPTPWPLAAEPLRSKTTVEPLAPERFKAQLTISGDTRDKLRRVRDLARHAIPNGDLATIFDRALTLLLNELEQRRCGSVALPRAMRDGAHGSRRIPAAVKREVLATGRRTVCLRRPRRSLLGAQLPRIPPRAALCRRRRGYHGEHRAPMQST